MSGDVQPRKRKDKRKKKDDEDFSHHHGSIGGSDEIIHIHKENKLGGNICSKIVFFWLLGALGVMVGLILIEYHGTNDVDTHSAPGSPWSVMLEDWVDNSPVGVDHNDHESNIEHSEEEEEHDDHDEGDDEYIVENSSEDLSKEDDNFGSSDNIHKKSKKVCEEEKESEEDEEEEEKEEDEEGEQIEEDEEEEEEIEENKEEIEEDEEEEEIEEVEEEDSEEFQIEESEEEKEDVSEEEENELQEENEDEGEEEDEIEEEEDKQTYLNTEENSEEDVGEHLNRDMEEDKGDLEGNNEKNIDKKFQSNKGLWKHNKRTIDLIESKQRKMYIYEIMKKLKKEEKNTQKTKQVLQLHKKKILQEEYEDLEESFNRKHVEKSYRIGEEENNVDEEQPLIDEDSRDGDEDETSGVALKFGVGVALVFVAHVVLIRKWSEGGEDLKHITDDEPETADVPPSFVERRQTLIPAEIMEDLQDVIHPQEEEYSEDEHVDVQDGEDVAFVKQTYEDLRNAYNHSTPDGSDVELTEDTNVKTDGYGSTESEPDPTEAEEEEEEDDDDDDNLQEDDPLGQWKSISGPEILAEEVEDVQTGSETSETEESEQEELHSSGQKSEEAEDGVYDNADITNQADWEIREELDEADRDLDDGDFPV